MGRLSGNFDGQNQVVSHVRLFSGKRWKGSRFAPLKLPTLEGSIRLRAPALLQAYASY